MIKTLDVVLTKDLNNQPMGLVCNFYGLYAEMSPRQMTDMARALLNAAADCQAQPEGPAPAFPDLRKYALSTGKPEETEVEIGANKQLQVMAAIMTLQMASERVADPVVLEASKRLSLLAMETLGLPIETLPAQFRPR